MLKVPDEKIIAALLTSSTNDEAAKKCQLTTRQFYNRLAAPKFKEKLNSARKELLDHAVSELETRLGAAAETMAEIMTDTKTAPQTRLNAADAIIKNALKLTERADILERMEKLERAVVEMEDRS